MTKLQYPLCGPQVCLRAACLTCLLYSTQHGGANWSKAIHNKEASVYVFTEGGRLGVLLFLALCHNYLIGTRLEVCFLHWLFIERC